MLWQNESFEKTGLDARYGEIAIKLGDPSRYEEVEKALSGLRTVYPDFTFRSRREISENWEMLQKTIESVYAAVAAAVLVFGALSLYSTEKLKAGDQRRTWGALRAAGIGRRHAILYKLCETSVNMFIAWIISLILSAAAAAFVASTVGDVFWYQLISWPTAFAAFVIAAAAGALIGTAQLYGIFKENIVLLVSRE